MEIKKIDDSTVEVKRSKTVETVAQFDISYLYKQIEDIERQKADFIAARDAEISEVMEIINGAEFMGVKKPE